MKKQIAGRIEELFGEKLNSENATKEALHEAASLGLVVDYWDKMEKMFPALTDTVKALLLIAWVLKIPQFGEDSLLYDIEEMSSELHEMALRVEALETGGKVTFLKDMLEH